MEAMLLPILLFAALGFMMYSGMRKQKRQIAATKTMQDQLVPGTRVMTTSGVHGTVTAVADDTIELELAPGVRTTWVKAAVREIVVPGPTTDLTDVTEADLGQGGVVPPVVPPQPAAPLDFTKDPARRDSNTN
ncbi:preprotein translocase subunit YajC [Nakamurella leprariae]|uniref:Preprotein translocase subunit YajC n=1 Tax=Nakamurella leprariae TaxID=2803911 RepID=A0A938YEN4_9ACTN|nr:preprotein translocase subunit YajC [Nakamurella leprariae]MBM9467032.1 preprotein translocase subunit YajC [Nakamurella leprariae]